MSCQSCPAWPGSAWSSLPRDGLRILACGKESRPVGAGQVIFREGGRTGGVTCVQSGIIALRKEDAGGNGIIVSLAGEGSLLGQAEHFCGTPAWTTAEALSPCRICFIDGATVHRVVSEHREVLVDMLRQVGGQLASAEGELLRQAVMPVRARVAALLLALRDRHGVVDAGGRVVISLPVNRMDLAALLRARRETVSRAMRALDVDGVVEFQGRSAIVPDLDALMDEVKEFTGM